MNDLNEQQMNENEMSNDIQQQQSSSTAMSANANQSQGNESQQTGQRSAQRRGRGGEDRHENEAKRQKRTLVEQSKKDVERRRVVDGEDDDVIELSGDEGDNNDMNEYQHKLGLSEREKEVCVLGYIFLFYL